MTPQRLTCLAVLLALFLPSVGQAAEGNDSQGYVALYGGLTIPQSLKETKALNVSPEVKLSDLSLARSAIAGAKFGMFLPGQDRWMGVEAEFFYTNPHIKQQDIAFTVGGVPAGTLNFAGAHVQVATAAVNWILRYPGERFQPYIGGGPGLFWGKMSGPVGELGTGSDTSLGLNALAGARFFVTKRFALFGEYKYNRASFDFGGTAQLHVLYQAQHFVAGFSLLF